MVRLSVFQILLAVVGVILLSPSSEHHHGGFSSFASAASYSCDGQSSSSYPSVTASAADPNATIVACAFTKAFTFDISAMTYYTTAVGRSTAKRLVIEGCTRTATAIGTVLLVKGADFAANSAAREAIVSDVPVDVRIAHNVFGDYNIVVTGVFPPGTNIAITNNQMALETSTVYKSYVHIQSPTQNGVYLVSLWRVVLQRDTLLMYDNNTMLIWNNRQGHQAMCLSGELYMYDGAVFRMTYNSFTASGTSELYNTYIFLPSTGDTAVRPGLFMNSSFFFFDYNSFTTGVRTGGTYLNLFYLNGIRIHYSHMRFRMNNLGVLLAAAAHSSIFAFALTNAIGECSIIEMTDSQIESISNTQGSATFLYALSNAVITLGRGARFVFRNNVVKSMVGRVGSSSSHAVAGQSTALFSFTGLSFANDTHVIIEGNRFAATLNGQAVRAVYVDANTAGTRAQPAGMAISIIVKDNYFTYVGTAGQAGYRAPALLDYKGPAHSSTTTIVVSGSTLVQTLPYSGTNPMPVIEPPAGHAVVASLCNNTLFTSSFPTAASHYPSGVPTAYAARVTLSDDCAGPVERSYNPTGCAPYVADYKWEAPPTATVTRSRTVSSLVTASPGVFPSPSAAPSSSRSYGGSRTEGVSASLAGGDGTGSVSTSVKATASISDGRGATPSRGGSTETQRLATMTVALPPEDSTTAAVPMPSTTTELPPNASEATPSSTETTTLSIPSTDDANATNATTTPFATTTTTTDGSTTPAPTTMQPATSVPSCASLPPTSSSPPLRLEAVFVCPHLSSSPEAIYNHHQQQQGIGGGVAFHSVRLHLAAAYSDGRILSPAVGSLVKATLTRGTSNAPASASPVVMDCAVVSLSSVDCLVPHAVSCGTESLLSGGGLAMIGLSLGGVRVGLPYGSSTGSPPDAVFLPVCGESGVDGVVYVIGSGSGAAPPGDGTTLVVVVETSDALDVLRAPPEDSNGAAPPQAYRGPLYFYVPDPFGFEAAAIAALLYAADGQLASGGTVGGCRRSSSSSSSPSYSLRSTVDDAYSARAARYVLSPVVATGLPEVVIVAHIVVAALVCCVQLAVLGCLWGRRRRGAAAREAAAEGDADVISLPLLLSEGTVLAAELNGRGDSVLNSSNSSNSTLDLDLDSVGSDSDFADPSINAATIPIATPLSPPAVAQSMPVPIIGDRGGAATTATALPLWASTYFPGVTMAVCLVLYDGVATAVAAIVRGQGRGGGEEASWVAALLGALYLMAVPIAGQLLLGPAFAPRRATHDDEGRADAVDESASRGDVRWYEARPWRCGARWSACGGIVGTTAFVKTPDPRALANPLSRCIVAHSTMVLSPLSYIYCTVFGAHMWKTLGALAVAGIGVAPPVVLDPTVADPCVGQNVVLAVVVLVGALLVGLARPFRNSAVTCTLTVLCLIGLGVFCLLTAVLGGIDDGDGDDDAWGRVETIGAARSVVAVIVAILSGLRTAHTIVFYFWRTR